MNRLTYCFVFVWALLPVGLSHATEVPDSTRHVVNDPVVSATMVRHAGVFQAKDENGDEPVYPDNVSLDPCSFPVESSIWSIALDTMLNDTICTLITPLVGDLDGDGIAEIVCFSNTLVGGGSAIYGGGNPGTKVKDVVVYDGFTHQRKVKFDLPEYVSAFEATPYGLARCANGDAMIVFACTDNNLYAYKFTSTTFSQAWGPVNYGSGNDYATVVGFADFNNDGNPEVYVRNKIFDLATGTLLLTVNSDNMGATYAHVGNITAAVTGRKPLAASFACDIVGDSQCELLLGNEIHSIYITNPYGPNGNGSQIYATAPSTEVSGLAPDGHAQVADFNLDGHLDVLFTSRPSAENQATVYVYVWDVYNNTVSTPIQQTVTQPGKSIPLIADIDNDGTPEVVLHCGVPGENVRAYKYNAATHTFSLFWTKGFSEDSYSNSLTLFDFNQDGESELLICDQNNISIVNGSTPALVQNAIATFPFKEVTIMQYPVIADVDNDGAAEIVFVGNENAATIQGSLNILRSGDTPWAPARPVWNQYMYNVTNVNKDLTIPAVQFNNAHAFSDNTGSTTVLRRPFNNFLQQATNIDTNGNPYRAAADLVPGEFTLTETEEGMLLEFEVCNIGTAIFITDSMRTCTYINTYQGPMAVYINTFNVDGFPFYIQAGDCYSSTILIPFDFFCPFMPFDSVCFALNDWGAGVGEGGLPPECDYSNNLVTLYAPLEPIFEEYYDTICTGQSYHEHGFEIEPSRTQQAGNLVDSLFNPDDCRFLAVLHLCIVGSGTVDTVARACDSFEWYGDIYEESGEFYHEIVSAAGCSQIIHLMLTVNYSTSTEQSVTACDSYSWHGQEYTQSGVFSYRAQTSAGCDSIVTLQLVVHYSDTANHETVTVCDSYDWHGETYTTSGRYTYSSTTADGCSYRDTLDLNIAHGGSVYDTLEQCLAFEWHGQNVDHTGDYTAEESTGECTLTYHLHFVRLSGSAIADTMIACDSYLWNRNGRTYSSSGTYSFGVYDTITGCFYAFSLKLTINHSDTLHVEQHSSCDLFRWHGTSYNRSGTYYYSDVTEEGCLYRETLELDIQHSARIDTMARACDSYLWRGRLLDSTDTYLYSTTTSAGCDSLVTLHLTIDPSYHLHDSADLCQGSSAIIHGESISQSGVYQFSFTTTHGCDSVYSTEVIVRPVYDHVDSVMLCTSNPQVGYRWVDGTVYYYSTTEPVIMLSSHYGCDSLLRLHLTVDRSLHAVIHCEPEFPTYDNNHVCLSNATSNYLTQRWYLFDGSVSEEPFCCFDMPFGDDSVMVRLVVSSGTGCFDTATLVIPMDRSTIYIPNVFTPNLATNNFFKVYGNSLQEAQILIYTREGMKIADLDALNEGWDGTHDGDVCPQGTYVYKVRYCTVLRPDEWHTVAGTVTLLR